MLLVPQKVGKDVLNPQCGGVGIGGKRPGVRLGCAAKDALL